MERAARSNPQAIVSKMEELGKVSDGVDELEFLLTLHCSVIPLCLVCVSFHNAAMSHWGPGKRRCHKGHLEVKAQVLQEARSGAEKLELRQALPAGVSSTVPQILLYFFFFNYIVTVFYR